MFYWFCLYWLSILGGSIKILQLAKGIWLSLMSFAIIGLWCRTRLHQGGRIDSHHSVAPGNHSEECHPPALGSLGRWSPLSKWEDRHQELHPGNQGSVQLHEPPQPHQVKAFKFQMLILFLVFLSDFEVFVPLFWNKFVKISKVKRHFSIWKLGLKSFINNLSKLNF